MDENLERALVQCASCGTPGAVLLDKATHRIVRAFFPCKCPRPSVEEANRAIRKEEHSA